MMWVETMSSSTIDQAPTFRKRPSIAVILFHLRGSMSLSIKGGDPRLTIISDNVLEEKYKERKVQIRTTK